MKKLLFRIALLMLGSGQLFAQTKVERNNIDGTPTTVTLPGNTAAEANREWLSALDADAQTTRFVLANTTTTGPQQSTVERYKQYYRDIPVELGGYTILFDKDGHARYMNGNSYKRAATATPSLSEAATRDIAIAALPAQFYAWQDAGWENRLKATKKDPAATWYPKGELVWMEDKTLKNEDRVLHLAYKFNVYALQPLRREIIYVDATNGKILYRDNQIKDVLGNGPSLYSGTVSFETQPIPGGGGYMLHDITRGGGINTIDCAHTNGTSSSGIALEVTSPSTTFASDAALDAHWGAEKVYDYWLIMMGRNSYDGSGAPITGYVHYLNNFDNAFWTGTEMVYGDGSGVISGGYSPLVALDICAHEIGHAVCQHTSNLLYEKESGALNEGFSDIWGAMVEAFANPYETDAKAKSIWQIGEEIGAAPLRRMDAPKLSSLPHQPDTYGGYYWMSPVGCVPNSLNDQCGVHINSGVLNRWFYLVCQGGGGTNDSGHAYSVSGIGNIKGAAIAYYTETMLTAVSNFANCRTTSISVATALYGTCSPEVEAVTRAWYAVGVGPNYTGASTLPITGPAGICAGTIDTMHNMQPGGIWSSSTANAAIGTSGAVTGVSPGTTTISYVTAGTCIATTTLAITAPPAAITGNVPVCTGAMNVLSDATPGGTWISANPAIAAISTGGNLTGYAAGITTVSYKTAYCAATVVVTVNATPVAITGVPNLCVGTSITYSNSVSGGTWSSSLPAIVTVNATSGAVTGIAAGTAIISYTTSCGSKTLTVTVNGSPTAITGNAPICQGSTITYGCTPAGGTWSSSALPVGTIDASGVFSALAAGTTTISYTNSCGTKTAIATVNPLPGAISGPSNLCVGISVTYSDPMAGGTWVESGSGLMSVGATGIVTGLTAGATSLKYTLPTGCYIVTSVTVNNMPSAISGPSSVCRYNSITLTNLSSGGTWSSGITGSVTVISASGIVTGVTPGPDTISYTMPGGCAVTFPVTVNPLPAPISGGLPLCEGNALILSSATIGGSWSHSTPAVAAISGIIPGACTATGLLAGTDTISYTIGSGCMVTTVLTVNPGVAPITGNNAVCMLNYTVLETTTTGGSWSSSNPAVATISPGGLINPVSTIPGMPVTTVTMTYTAPTACTASYTVSVFKNDGLCSPCNTANFGIPGGAGHTFPFNTLGMSGSIAAPIDSGCYYLINNATVYGDITADNARIMVAPGLSLTVQYAASLTLNGTHLFSCDNNMWQGIALQSGVAGPDSVTGRIVLQGSSTNGRSTLVEDAVNGISVNGSARPNSGGSFIIDSRDAIFNRNYIGISITNHTPVASTLPGLPNQYEYRISRTTFTSRKLVTHSYIVNWPDNYSPGGLRTNITTSNYVLPYGIIDSTSLNCRNGQVPVAGIYLEGVGKTTGSSYTGALVGAPGYYGAYGPTNDVWNLFDNLGNGIVAVNSNISVQNNVFANLRTTATGGTLPSSSYIDRAGVYTNMNDGNKYRLEVVPAVSGYGATAMSCANSFYDCRFGVYSKDYNIIKCEKSVMRSTQNLFMDGYSRYGFMLQSASYEDVRINENKIYNIANGIAFTSAFGMSYPIFMPGGIIMYGMPYQHLGNVAINSNSIQAVMGAAASIGEYVSTGISVQNALPAGTSNTPVGNVQTMGNYMKDVHRGILVQGYQTQQAITSGNNIGLTKYLCEKSWGVAHANNHMDVVSSNTVTCTYDKYDVCMDSARGYIMELDHSSLVTCNSASGTGRGFEFFHTNEDMQWKHNTMDRHNVAMYLNNASIDQQGYLYHPNDNRWNDPTWWSLGSKDHTFVLGTPDAAASPLFVRSGAVTQPTANNSFPAPNRYLLSATPPRIIITSGGFDQNVCPIQEESYPAMARAAHEQPILDAIEYDALSDARLWISQLQVWEAINHDATLSDSSAILSEFRTKAAGSRFGYLTQVEHLLTSGDMAGAASLLGTTPSPLDPALTFDSTTGVTVKDDSTIDYIINTHKDFYKIYLHYLNRSMNGTDSAKIPYIAQLCPLQYGEVVYKARALYTAVWNDLRVWCEGCDVYNGQQQPPRNKKRRVTKPATDNGNQQYTLTPNPNTGTMNITQVAGDSENATVEITDMLGRSILQQAVNFTGKTAPLALQNAAPGMYVLKLTDNKGRTSTFKFIVQ